MDITSFWLNTLLTAQAHTFSVRNSNTHQPQYLYVSLSLSLFLSDISHFHFDFTAFSSDLHEKEMNVELEKVHVLRARLRSLSHRERKKQQCMHYSWFYSCVQALKAKNNAKEETF